MVAVGIFPWAVGCARESGRNGDDAATFTGDRAPVDDYVQFAARLEDEGGAGLEDTEIADGLRGLAAALGVLGLGDPELPVDLRIAAEHVLLNPDSPDTAETVRDRLIAAAEALDGRAGGGTALRPAAEALDPQRPLTEQRETLVDFFQRSGMALSG